ncbi:hypothetical protein [Peribacillus sp. Bi96]|uniref:hypothetical protein n=1 Tax=Peribacillus sp. Bi96 TaxID=2884273 RepID=UPI001E4DECAD|nr:hypothetical protein [Peribacillus sp. Bi96]
MKKYINKIRIVGFILSIMLMVFSYGVMFFCSAFLDATPHTNPKSTEVDHGRSKIWEGMSKEEYQHIKQAEEMKKSNYVDYKDEPTFDPDEPSEFNLFEGGNENDEY